jgi:DNA repair exonuclease SbcCD ATPase subunit
MPQGAGRQQAAQQINERKGQLEKELRQLETNVTQAARDAAKDEKAAARKLSEAASEISDNQLAERVRQSQGMVSRGNDRNQLEAAESDITEGIDKRRQQAWRGAAGARCRPAAQRATGPGRSCAPGSASGRIAG